MTQQLSKAYIIGDGVISPLGHNAVATNLAVKAGINVFKEVEFYDENFYPLKMAIVPEDITMDSLDESLIRETIHPKHARMLGLAKTALQQLLDVLPKSDNIPLLLACPESERFDEPNLNNRFISLLAQQVAYPINMKFSRIFHTGRAGTMDALDMAFHYLQSNISSFVLVGGVDTAYDLNTCKQLLNKSRLLTPDNLDGFIPGEASGFLLLSRSPINPDHSPFLLPPGLSIEDGHLYSPKACLGNGLTEAVRKSLLFHTGSKIEHIYSTLNGESFFAKELGPMLARNNDSFTDNVTIQHPADCYGDPGAAAGILMISQIYQKLINKQSCSPNLVYCSSDGAYRGATVVSC